MTAIAGIKLRTKEGRLLLNSEVDNNFTLLDGGIDQLRAALNVQRYGDGPYPVLDAVFGGGASILDPRVTHTRPGDSYRIVNGVLRKYDPNEPVLTGAGLDTRPAETNLVWPSVPASGTWGAINATWGDTVEAAGYTLRRVNVGAAGTGAAKYITRTNMSAAAGEIVLLALVVLPNAGNSTLGLSFTGYGAWEGDGGAAADFDLLAGTSSWVGGPGVAKGMQQLEDGAWLCWTVGKKKSDASDTSLSPAIAVWPTGTASSGTEHLHVGGVHVVKGFTAPIPYIPTTSGAVTRPADDASIQGDAFASVWNPQEGAIILDFKRHPFDVGGGSLFRIDDTSNANQIWCSAPSANGLVLQTLKNSSVTKSFPVSPVDFSAGVKVGYVWDATTLKIYVDEILRGTAAVGADVLMSMMSRFRLAYVQPYIARRLTIFDQAPQ